MVVTCGTSWILANIASTVDWTAGSVTLVPSVVWKTICSRSPATLGAADWSRLSAWVDSVLGRVKLLENAVPTDARSRSCR